MLSFEEKVKYFESVLDKEEVSYADTFNCAILQCHENSDFEILNDLKTLLAIDNYLRALKSYIVMHEDDDEGNSNEVDDLVEFFGLPDTF